MKVTRNFNQNTLDNDISKDPLIVDTKRESKILHRSKKQIEPKTSLMVCQNLIAIKKGYKDWFDLYQSVKRRIENNLSLPKISNLEEILHQAYLEKASDIHIEFRGNDAKVRFRTFGLYFLHVYKIFEKEELFKDLGNFFKDFKINDKYQFACSNRSLIINHQAFKYSIQTVPHYDSKNEHNMDAMIKVHYSRSSPLSFEKLGFLPSQIKSLNKMVDEPSGAILIAGTCGSGKSTSVYQIGNKYSRESNHKVYSINSSFEMENDNFVKIEIPYRESQDQILNYIDIIKSNISNEAQMVVIDEIRNKGDGIIINKAYESGIKLISTIHASGVVGIIDRLADLNLSYQQSAKKNMISGLIYQKLMPCLCQHCSISLENNYQYLDESNNTKEYSKLWNEIKNLLPNNNLNNVRVRNQNGCKQCKFGVNGRILVAEMIEIDDGLRKHINTSEYKQIFDAWRNTSDKDILSGNHVGKTIDENCLYHVLRGSIALDDFHRYFRLSQVEIMK